MGNQKFKDEIRQGRGFFPSAPLHTQNAVGDAALAGKNCLFNKYGQIRSWRAFSPYNSPGTKLLHVVGQNPDSVLAGNQKGNIWKQHGSATFFIGEGLTYEGDFYPTHEIGVSTSRLQIRLGDKTYRAGLPQPAAPVLSIPTDSAGQPLIGQVTGNVSAQLTRIRTITGAEGAASLTSNVITPVNGRVRLAFPECLTDDGQDQWGVYLSPQGFGGVGPHQLYKTIYESQLTAFALGSLATAAGDGITDTFSGTTVDPVDSRAAVVTLNPAAAILPSYVSSSFANTPGESATLRVPMPVGGASGDYLMVQVTFVAKHKITPAATNKGTETIDFVGGAWFGGTFPLNPQNVKIIVKQDSTTTFVWKYEDDLTFSLPIALTTVPYLLDSNQISIRWSAASTSSLEVGNTFTIEPFKILPPPGWQASPIEWQGNENSAVGLGVYGRPIDAVAGYAAPVGDLTDWTASEPTQMSALAVLLRDVDNVAPTGPTFSATQVAGTTHDVTISSAPDATHLITFWFSGDGDVDDYTPDSPLTEVVSTRQAERVIDIDYVDGDLLEQELAPRGIEPPPEGTHGFPLGPVTVVAGIFNGTALAPSRPNKPEQYDIANDVVYLVPPEPIVRIDIHPIDGSIYIWTRNSLQTVIYTGATVEPVSPRTIWGSTGIANPSGACLSKTGAYASTALRGFARYRGNLQPDTDFADPVSDYVKDWRPEGVVVGYDGRLDGIAFCYGNQILFYHEALGAWSPPLRLTIYDGENVSFANNKARIVSAATLEGRLYLSVQFLDDSSEDYEIFVFDEGLGGEWFLRSVTRHGGNPGRLKTLRSIRLVADLSSEQVLDYYWANGIHHQIDDEVDKMVMDNPEVSGYALSRLWLPREWMERGGFYLEWDVHGPFSADRGVYFASQTSLRKYGSSPTLPTTTGAAGSRFGWQITTADILQWWKNGSPTVKGTVLDGDKIRIVWDSDGEAQGYLIRNGVPVGSPFPLKGALPWPDWIGFKMLLDDNGEQHVGRLAWSEGIQTGNLKVWKNFAGERDGAAEREYDYVADGDKTYPWERPNITQIVTYNIEVGGNTADQDVSVVYADGYITGERHSSLLTQ